MQLKARASITRRLTLLFILSSSVVLWLLGLVIAAAVEQHFEEQDVTLLSGKMALARSAVADMKTLTDLRPITHLIEHSLVGLHGLEVLVLDAQRQPLFATSDALFAVDQVLASAARGPAHATLWQQNGRVFRGIAAELPSGVPGAQVTVAMATDIGHHQEFMASFRRTLWLFVAGAALLSGVLGWFVARRGLAPLRDMREQTRAVNAQQLNRRLAVDAVPVELAELAQSLNDMLARLEEAFNRISAFSSDIAHELRTPVSNLMTQTQVALSRARTAEEYRGILESNAEEYEHMARMISDLLLLAKAENGLAAPHKEPVELADEVRALFDYYDALAEEKQVALSVYGSASIAADRHLLRRALGNLLSNALRHARTGSTVVVHIATGKEGVALHIENAGDMIPADLLERIFERFFRVDTSRQRSGEGTGLGLAIAKSIVVAHGGKLSATSDAASTRFTVSLPS